MKIDQSLIIRLQKQDREAFKEIYEICSPSLYRFALKMVKSPELAEDVCHDVFIKLWDNAPHLDPNRPVLPFLFEIAKNQLLNFIRRSQLEKVIITQMMQHAEMGIHSTEYTYQFREATTLLSNAIEQLPAKRKHIFQLCKEEDLSYAEVASRLQISESTVNNQMVKALKFVKGSISTLLFTLFFQ